MGTKVRPYRGVMTLAETLVPALLGLGTALSIIIAIGAQNAFVLRIGIAGHNRLVLVVVLVCVLSDAVLISAGVLGIGAIVQRAPVGLLVIRIVGSGFLIVYGLLAARRVFRPRALVAEGQRAPIRVRTAALTALALTWLNPHVYLDTVILLGALANHQGQHERWWWVGGAIAGSFLWFFTLGFGARYLRPFFARPSSWRILDGIIAVVMLTIGARLAIGF